MKYAVPCLYATYGRYTDELRAIPFHLDCLKPVERRLLYTLHKVAKKLTKSARVVGDCIGRYHPHGDGSTYGSLISLVQRGFAVGQGNWGGVSLKPSRAAAYRYTEVKINEVVEQIAFELINYVAWGDPENLQEEQPLYLTTPVPLGLIGSGVISGISFNTTKMPRYTLKDLITRLINAKQRQYDPSIAPVTIIPSVPNFTVEEGTPGDFEKILSTGVGSIVLKPLITADVHGVHVWGRPPGGVSSWMKNPEEQIYNVDDMTTGGIFEALFTPKDRVPYDQAFVNHIVKLTESKVHFKCNVVVDDGTVHTKSVDELLIGSYDNWNKCLLAKYQSDKHSLEEKLYHLKVIAIIRQIVNSHGGNLNKIEDIVQIFNQSFAQANPIISADDIRKTCSKNNIRTLIEVSIDTQTVMSKISSVQKSIDDIDNIAYNKMVGYIS